MSLFTKRHYEWLADFAAYNLSHKVVARLCEALKDDNINFKEHKFHNRIDKNRGITHTTNPTQYRGTFTTHNLK